MKNLKRFLIIFVLFITYLLLSIFSYSNAVSEDLSNSVFRLHVIANSNSKEDQNLKYLVRDELIKYMNSISRDIYSKEEAIDLVKENKDNFYTIAKKVISDNGYNYDVNIEIGNFSFPTKTYGDISLPAGFYDALKVEIGKAQGQNWWCVMFPSLCFVDVSNGVVPEESKEALQSNMQGENYNLISSDSLEFKLKFKFCANFGAQNCAPVMPGSIKRSVESPTGCTPRTRPGNSLLSGEINPKFIPNFSNASSIPRGTIPPCVCPNEAMSNPASSATISLLIIGACVINQLIFDSSHLKSIFFSLRKNTSGLL